MSYRAGAYYKGADDLGEVLAKHVASTIAQIENFGAPRLPRHFEKAKELARSYEQGTGLFTGRLSKTVFPNVPRKVFAGQLLSRLDKPHATNQGDTYLCGAAATTHLLLNLDPLNYVRVAIMLFETGEVCIYSSDFTASNPMRRVWRLDAQGAVVRTKDSEGDVMGIVDFVVVGSLRNGENWKYFLNGDLDPEDGNQWDTQMTPPNDMEEFLEDYCGFQVPEFEYWNFWNSEAEDPASLQQAHEEGKWMVLFIDKGLSAPQDGAKTQKKLLKEKYEKAKEKNGLTRFTGSHFVVVEPRFDFVITKQGPGNERVCLQFWDYGRFDPKNVNVTKAQFMLSVKGYWLVEPKYK